MEVKNSPYGATCVATACAESANGDMEFSDKVRALMKRDGCSQADLAEAIGTNQPQISRWLESDTIPKVHYLSKIARFFDVSVDFLIDPEQEEPPRPEVSDDERSILELYRALGLSKREGLRRLATEPAEKPAPAPKPSGPVGGLIDMTKMEVRQQRERRRPTNSGGNSEGKGKGTDPTGVPRRGR